MFRFFVGVFVLSITTDIVLSIFINTLPDGVTLHNVVHTWEEAQSQCVTEGGVLASPINETIYNYMKSLIDVKNRTFYIGARVTDLPGQFVSVEGVPLENMTVAMINMSPVLDPLEGDCVAMNSDSMRVVPCWTRLPYMCLRSSVMEHETTESTSPVMETTSTTESTSPVMETTSTTESTNPVMETTSTTERPSQRTGNTDCGTDEGYKYDFSQHTCYKRHAGYTKTWAQAEQTCVDEGGHLVVIDNESEARTVMEMLNDNRWSATWTGIHYSAAEDNWISVRANESGCLSNDDSFCSLTDTLGDFVRQTFSDQADGKRVEDLYSSWYDGHKPYNNSLCVLFHDKVLGWKPCHNGNPFICEKNNQ